MFLKLEDKSETKVIDTEDLITYLNKEHPSSIGKYFLKKNMPFYKEGEVSHKHCISNVPDIKGVKEIFFAGTAVIILREFAPDITITDDELDNNFYYYKVRFLEESNELILVENTVFDNKDLHEHILQLKTKKNYVIDFSKESIDSDETKKHLSTFLEYEVQAIVNWTYKHYRLDMGMTDTQILTIEGIGNFSIMADQITTYEDFLFVRRRIVDNHYMIMVFDKKLREEK